MSTCLVREADYRRYWAQIETPTVVTLVWNGVDRRVNPERRRGFHDRRWEAQRGRRFRTRRASHGGL